MNYIALKSEIDTDSLGRGYSGMTDAEVAADMNTTYRSRIRQSMSGDEVFNATDSTEFTGLTDHKRELWVAFTSKDALDPTATTNISLIDFIFGGASTTKSNLATLRDESISRAIELDLGTVNASHVEQARTI